jgi:hypothetical protein
MSKNQIHLSGNASFKANNVVIGDDAQLTIVAGGHPPASVDSPRGARHQVVLSYRRNDSRDITGRIYDRLVHDIGKESVFRDIDSIPLAIAYPQRLEQAIRDASIVFVIIGPNWVSAANDDGSLRLFDPADYVRREVELALQFGVPIAPLTIAGARKPRADELPDSIKPLATRQGLSIRPDPDFHRDMDDLIRQLGEATFQVPAGNDRPVRSGTLG